MVVLNGVTAADGGKRFDGFFLKVVVFQKFCNFAVEKQELWA